MIDKELNQMMDSAEQPVIPQDVEQESIFTGEEIQVAGWGKEALEGLGGVVKKAFSKGPKDTVELAPNVTKEVPAIVNAAPITEKTVPAKVDVKLNKQQKQKLKEKVELEKPVNIDEFNVQVNQSKQEIQDITTRMEAAATQEIKRPELPKVVSSGMFRFETTAIDKPLYRETNGNGLDDLLKASYTQGNGDTLSLFVTDNADLAIGQGDNTGVFVKFRNNALSGKENIKPGTGDLAGREYKTDFVGLDAIDSITIKNETKIRPVSLTLLKKYFDKNVNEAGDIVFTRKNIKENVNAVNKEVQAIAQELKPTNKVFNLIRASDDIDEQSILDAISKSYNVGNKSYVMADVMKLAEEAGYDANFINSLAENTLTANRDNMAKALLLQRDLTAELVDTFKSVVTKEGGVAATQEQRLEATQKMQLYSYLFRQIKGYSSDASAATNMRRVNLSDIDTNTQLKELYNNVMPGDRFDDLARMIVSDTFNPADLGNVIHNAVLGDNGWDIAKKLYSNSILGRPGTITRLTVGESVKSLFLPVTRAYAAASWYPTYPIKKMLGLSTEEKYYFSETMAMYKSYRQAIGEGWGLAAKAWKSGGTASQEFGRAEMMPNKSTDIFNYDATTLRGKGLATLNFLATYGNKLTLSGGEFFKGINHRLENVANATRQEIKALDDAISDGRTIEEAEMISKNKYAEALNNPPESLWTDAKHSALEQDAGPLTKKIEELTRIDGPVGLGAKALFAFTRTAINDIYNTIEHSPAGLVIPGGPTKWDASFSANESLVTFLAKGGPFNKRLMEDLKSADPKRIDMATGRAALGSTLLYEYYNLANEGYLTGNGPANQARLQEMTRAGWQKNSLKVSKKVLFPFSQSEGELTAEQQSIVKAMPGTTAGTGEYKGYVFISLAGLGYPGNLAKIAGNYAEYMKYEKDNEKISQNHGALVAAISDYMDDDTILQGSARLVSSLHIGRNETETATASGIVSDTTSAIADMVLNFTGVNGALSAIRTQTDDLKRDTKPDPNQSAGMQAIERSVNEFVNKVPFASNSLRPARNLWGEYIDNDEYPNSPIRMIEGKAKAADMIIQMSQANVRQPEAVINTKVSQEGREPVNVSVPLTPDEYDAFIDIYTKEYRLESNIRKISDNLGKMKTAFGLDDKTIPKQEKDIREVEMMRAVAAQIEQLTEETFSAAKEKLYNDSKFSRNLQIRAEREAKNKLSTYKLTPIVPSE